MTPESISGKQLNQMGLILPALREGVFTDFIHKNTAILGGAATMLAGIGASIYSTARPDRADAGVEVCSTSLGEVPQPQSSTGAGVDIMTYRPSLSNELCVGHETKVTTFVQNKGSSLAKNVVFSISGKAAIINSLSSISINDKPLQIIEKDQQPTAEYCEWYRFDKDRGELSTSRLNCNYGLWPINLGSSEKFKIDVVLKPTSATQPGEIGGDSAVLPKAPYIEFSASDFPITDKNTTNNSVRRDLFVRDQNGNKSLGSGSNINKQPDLKLKVVDGKKGTKVLRSSISTNKCNIIGIGNGASNKTSERRKAARVVLTLNGSKIKLGILPKNMLRVGKNIFIDIPNIGIKPRSTRTIKTVFVPGAGRTVITGRLIVPKGKVTNCSSISRLSNSTFSR